MKKKNIKSYKKISKKFRLNKKKKKSKKNKKSKITTNLKLLKIHLILVLSFISFISFFLKKQENINQKYKISVIIPTYNRANLITKSINSVLSQTYKNIELLIIDDNSEDETETIVKNINDSRIKYIKLKENKGAAYARNV